MLANAKKYLEKGISVIPVGKDKKPLINWKEFQTRRATEEELDQWWSKWPDANIGIVTGRISNLAVVDIEEGGSVDGLPPTLMAKTGGGGWHFYYKYEDGIENKARFRELADIRGEGGYVVAPPSLHASGKNYEWLDNQEPEPFPKNLIPKSKKTDWKKYVNGVVDGSRTDTATRVCGKLMRTFKPDEWEMTVYPMLQNWNQSNKPPMTERELRVVFEGIGKRAVNDDREEDPAPQEGMTSMTKTQAMMNAYDEIKATDPKKVLSFGYEWIDEKLVGIFPGEIITIGGETGTGKSHFANDILYSNSKKTKCAMFSMEERAEDYEKKALYFEIGRIRFAEGSKNFPWRAFVTGELNDEPTFLEYIARAYDNLKNENVTYESVGERQVTIELVQERIKDLAAKGVKLFLIDHLHYFNLLKGKDSKADYIESVMVRLHTLVKSIGVSVIMIAHYKKLAGAKPSVDSFKDSISIAQISTTTINLWRDRSNDATEADRLTTYFYIPKTRQIGGEGFLRALFNPVDGRYSKLTNEEAADF